MTQQQLTSPGGADVIHAVENLTRRNADPHVVLPANLPEGVYLTRRRDDEIIEIRDLEQLEAYPRERRGWATVHDSVSFATYAHRLATPAMTIWAVRTTRMITALFDDHRDIDGTPGWRQAGCRFKVQVNPDWQTWLNANGPNRAMTQLGFAEFVESMLHTVAAPPANTFLEAIDTFTSKRRIEFDSAVNVQNGMVQMRFHETQEGGAQGTTAIPTRFTLKIAPFLGVAPVEIEARLRYRIPTKAGDPIAMWFELVRPDIAEDAAFAELVDFVRDAFPETPVLLGPCPDPVDSGPFKKAT